MRFCWFPLIVVICLATSLRAQSEAKARYQIYGGYSWLSNSFNGFPGARQSLNGWDASVAFPAWHSLRFKIDAAGYSGTNLNAPQKGLFILAGGQYSYTIKRETLYVQGLIGDAAQNRDWGPQGSKSGTAAFASFLGGGFDTAISRHFAYRVDGGFQYAYTSLIGPGPAFAPYRVPGLPTNFGRISTGLVWQF